MASCRIILCSVLLLLSELIPWGSWGPAPAAAESGMPASLTLVENSEARSVIVLADDAAAPEKLAAQELQQYVQKISGVTLNIAGTPGANQIPIRLGRTAMTPQLEAVIKARGSNPDSFVLKAGAGGISVAGLTPDGTLFGVYELLEQLGVRWFMPGGFGTVIPTAKTVSLRVQETVQVPSFNGRWENAGRDFAEWGRHVRMNGPFFPPAHGVPGLKDTLFKEHPEYFALVNGKRTTRQINVSNPEVIRLVTEATKAYFRKNPDAAWIGMGPNDGSGYCECEQCRKST